MIVYFITYSVDNAPKGKVTKHNRAQVKWLSQISGGLKLYKLYLQYIEIELNVLNSGTFDNDYDGWSFFFLQWLRFTGPFNVSNLNLSPVIPRHVHFWMGLEIDISIVFGTMRRMLEICWCCVVCCIFCLHEHIMIQKQIRPPSEMHVLLFAK